MIRRANRGLRSTCGLVVLVFALLAAAVTPADAQGVNDLFHITDGTSQFSSGFHQISIARGAEQMLAEFDGPGKVTYFYMTDDTAGHWYPGLVLKVYWDDGESPSIVVPLADFFGAVGGRSVDYVSAVMQVNQACYMCYLPMPFSKKARIVLANDGDRDWSQKVAFGVDVEHDAQYADVTSRLHCEWRRSNAVKNGLHTIMETTGRGQYVGGTLQVVSRKPSIWFGEGDTVVTIDGKPGVHTPGTEDEYGSCWADPQWKPYALPFCGHVMNEAGVNRMYRWYVVNPIRFQKSIKVEIQNQHDNVHAAPDDESDDYVSVAFWYQEGAHRVSDLPAFEKRVEKSFASSR